MADVKKCTCKSPFQDKLYGIGMRAVTRNKAGEARCTVCGGKARWEERVRQHWNSPSSPPAVIGSPMNPNLCTENRMVKK